MLPFYPSGAAAGIAVAAGLAAFRAPRAGLALALAAPVFPLGNVSLGLALVYGAVALAWLALSWRDARFGLAFLAGPLLAPIGLLALVPVAVAGSRGAARRAAQALAAVAVAAVAAGLRGWDLPFRQGAVPPLDLQGADSAATATAALVEAVPARSRPRGARARRDRRRTAVCPHPVADRRPRRRRARGHAPRGAVRTGSAARRSRLAHLRRARAQVRALDSSAGGTVPLTE